MIYDDDTPLTRLAYAASPKPCKHCGRKAKSHTPTRAFNALMNSGVVTVGDFLKMPLYEYARLRQIGEKSLLFIFRLRASLEWERHRARSA